MRQRYRAAIKFCAIASLTVCAAPSALAEAVDGTWVNAVGFGDGPIHFPDTNSPIVGENPNDPDFGVNDADQEMIYSGFTPMTLANSGDKIVFTGSVELAGTINSPATSGTPRTQFRFGLFKDDGNGDDLGWVGYLLLNAHGNTGTPNGGLTRKNVGNNNVFLSNSNPAGGPINANSLISAPGNGTVFNDDTYALNMTIERIGADLNISGSITGTAATNFTQSLTVTDTAASTLGTYQFDRLGFLTGGNLDADRAAYMNLDVTFVPAPTGQPGDYNGDGTVDAADYTVWRKGGPLLNDTNPAGVGPEDYAKWVEQFGTGGGGGAQSLVPEPTCIVLLATGAIVATCRRRAQLVLKS